MRKKIIREKTIQLECGKAKPGATLASFGINMPNFCREFNDKTRSQEGKVNVKLVVYEDKTYQLSIEGTPITDLLKKAMEGKKEKTITEAELKKIIQTKLPYLNTDDPEKARKIIKGTIRSHHIKVEE